MSFSDFEYAAKRKQTRRERFLGEMEQVVPWSGLVALIEPHYPKAGGGRRPYPLETMLRIHLLQNWFSLSDPVMEEALYEITSMRQFARLTLSAGRKLCELCQRSVGRQLVAACDVPRPEWVHRAHRCFLPKC